MRIGPFHASQNETAPPSLLRTPAKLYRHGSRSIGHLRQIARHRCGALSSINSLLHAFLQGDTPLKSVES
jgi:hypothetical protein